MNPSIQRTEIRIPARSQRRQLCSRFNLFAPALDNSGDGARRVSVRANFIKVAQCAFLQRRGEWRRDEDLGLGLDDELSDIRRPSWRFCRCAAGLLAMGETIVGPDVDYLIERATSVCQKAASFEKLSRAGSAWPKRSSTVAMVPGFRV
jgi:hypothetical protein